MSGGAQAGDPCSATSECTTFPRFGFCSLVTNATAGTCSGGSCTGTYWSTNGSRSCAANADCAVPVDWCTIGCPNTPDCSGVCLQYRQNPASEIQDWGEIVRIAEERNNDTPQSNDIHVIAISQPVGAIPGFSTVGDSGCWSTAWRQFDANASRVKAVAQLHGLSWIDHNLYARDNCPDGDRGECTSDGIHYNAVGVDVAVDVMSRCISNLDGTSSTYYSCDFSQSSP